MKLSIGIKALNEEAYIASALNSAVNAAKNWQGEVVLADSGSTDQTIAIAMNYPVRIFQLANKTDQSCGAGAQLAFQHSRGEYFYLLDGDMVLDKDFLPVAISFLDAHPEVAAVGGHVREMNMQSQEFQIRANAVAAERHRTVGEVDRLDGGGLYRRAAVLQSGFFADRNLHGFEEVDLAARLQILGWKLARIDQRAVDHYGHQTDGYKLLWRRMKSGYASAPGEILRGAAGRKHMTFVLTRLSHIRNSFVVIAWWLCIVSSAIATTSFTSRTLMFGLLVALPFSILSWRRGSASLGMYSLASWNVTAIGLVTGFLRARVLPTEPLKSITLKEC